MAMPPAVANEWSTGLCDVCGQPGGCGTCCYSTCCGPCQYGQNVDRMSAEVACGGSCGGACCLFWTLGGIFPTLTAAVICIPIPLACTCIPHTSARGWLRKKYNIPGSCCADCLTTTFCIPCALCQEHRELTIRGLGRLGEPVRTAGGPTQVIMVPMPGYNQVTPAYGAPVPVKAEPPHSYSTPAYGPPPTQQYIQAYPGQPQ